MINLYGGPGSGKSTTAAGLFAMMKLRGHKVELVTEFAKDLTYTKNFVTLANQLAVLGEQDHRLRRLDGHVDFVITDSPLLLSMIYSAGIYDRQWFRNAVLGAFSEYQNEHFVLHRVKPYEKYGRTQSEDQARELDLAIRGLLKDNGFSYHEIPGNVDAPALIYNELFGPAWTKEI